jgi:hypothetical protein
MTERLDPLVSRSLERWRVIHETPAWEDVVARAGMVARRRLGRRRLYVAVAVCVAVGVAAPALALVASHYLGSRAVPGTFATARVDLGDARAASLHLRSHGSSVGRDRRGFYYLGRPADSRSRAFDWRLELTGVERVAGAQIEIAGRTVELCRSCDEGSAGTFVLHGNTALKLLDGHATLQLGVARAAVPPAAGGRLRKRSPSAG